MSENPPKPLVKSVVNIYLSPKIREGRGFSISELREVGLTIKEARKLRLRVDENRRSKHDFNVEVLRKYLENLKAKGSENKK